MQDQRPPVRVALINDFDVIVRGLQEIFDNHFEFQLADATVGEAPRGPVDIVLYDTFAGAPSIMSDLRTLADRPDLGRVVVYSWDMRPEHVSDALHAGASGYLSKKLDAEELRRALLRVHAGETVVLPAVDPTPVSDEELAIDRTGLTWPGREEGLTFRESEVLGLIAKGLSNQQVAESLFLSINSVKSYIRSAYRKIGAERRSQAVLWSLRHGLASVKVGVPAADDDE